MRSSPSLRLQWIAQDRSRLCARIIPYYDVRHSDIVAAVAVIRAARAFHRGWRTQGNSWERAAALGRALRKFSARREE